AGPYLDAELAGQSRPGDAQAQQPGQVCGRLRGLGDRLDPPLQPRRQELHGKRRHGTPRQERDGLFPGLGRPVLLAALGSIPLPPGTARVTAVPPRRWLVPEPTPRFVEGRLVGVAALVPQLLLSPRRVTPIVEVIPEHAEAKFRPEVKAPA